jgi:hypothetical protein
VEEMKTRWKSFRRGLRQENKKFFDRFFQDASKHSAAASYMNPKNPATTIFLSAMIQQQKRIDELEEKMEKKEVEN